MEKRVAARRAVEFQHLALQRVISSGAISGEFLLDKAFKGTSIFQANPGSGHLERGSDPAAGDGDVGRRKGPSSRAVAVDPVRTRVRASPTTLSPPLPLAPVVVPCGQESSAQCCHLLALGFCTDVMAAP